jgi:hypothetical protein
MSTPKRVEVYLVNTKRIIGFIVGLAVLGLQVPGLLMVFSAPDIFSAFIY